MDSDFVEIISSVSMRCPIGDKGEGTNAAPSGWSIWSTTSFLTPNIVQTVDGSDGNEAESFSDEMSSICALDPVSSSQKRKILECEREDFEGRFHKIQRKKQLQRAAAKANLVIDDSDDDDDFDEEKIYEEMEWIEQGNNVEKLHSWEHSEVDDMSFESIERESPLLPLHKLKWREERRRLLKISMAKIRCVEDPEAYLRRSVLINNTVKRLQKDTLINYRFHSAAPSSSFHGSSAYQNESNIWSFGSCNLHILHKEQQDIAASGFDCASSRVGNDSVVTYSYPEVQVPYSASHMSLVTLSASKSVEPIQNDTLQNTLSFPNKSTSGQQVLNDTPACSRTLKQPAALHVFSTQSCGLQYRHSTHSEDTDGEYHESPGSSSVLDSVVYHSLIASLES